MSNTYTDQVLEHFKNPRNLGKMQDPDGVGKIGSPECGDVVWVYIKVVDNVIVDCKFQTLGCAAAIASSSMLTEIVKGKTIEEALAVTNNDVVKELGGLPNKKMHCSLLAEDGIKEAIKDYRIRHNKNM
ncbi:MAG: iron-sulfur cluster assembly scaffold protein [Candidatus Omnitrophota bacterium]|nr:iron-sulfur cluster assembly scaffold protein [Candidatus Omnitrophota bacterium]